MAVDRGKALADYASFCENAFTQAFFEYIDEWLRQIRTLQDDADEGRDLYRCQGKVYVLKALPKKPDELAKALAKNG